MAYRETLVSVFWLILYLPRDYWDDHKDYVFGMKDNIAKYKHIFKLIPLFLFLYLVLWETMTLILALCMSVFAMSLLPLISLLV